VWLNSASSLRFPASFTGKERMVELTGEGYFEIAKNKAMPFHVKANGADITVLGTHFNVNAYSDEAVTATTLLEGKVKVTGKAGTNYLDPGQQAAMDKTGALKTLDYVNVEEVMAWKNGLFHFDGASLQSVLRQAARWYNVRFEYNANIEGGFSGEITRNVNLSQLLKILELTGKVKFTIQGNTVKVHQ
jgi:transmembrane sensor